MDRGGCGTALAGGGPCTPITGLVRRGARFPYVVESLCLGRREHAYAPEDTDHMLSRQKRKLVDARAPGGGLLLHEGRSLAVRGKHISPQNKVNSEEGNESASAGVAGRAGGSLRVTIRTIQGDRGPGGSSSPKKDESFSYPIPDEPLEFRSLDGTRMGTSRVSLNSGEQGERSNSR